MLGGMVETGTIEPTQFDARTRLYIWLTGAFVTCLLVADITGSKFFHFDVFTVGLPVVGDYNFVTHSAGMLSFPITFLLTDLINEYYGRRGARRITYIGVACAAMAFTLIFTARKLPVAVGSPIPQDTFDAVFAMSNRLYIASLTAFLVGQLMDIWLFGVLKRLSKGRMVWLRATGSTLVSQAMDSFLVSAILLYGTVRVPAAGDTPAQVWSVGQILEVAFTGYLLKIVLSVCLTPVIYLGRWLIRTRLGLSPVAAEKA